MSVLTNEQREDIRMFLEERGLTFRPLQDEMFDHIVSDMEEQVSRGVPYESAWETTLDHLHIDHFKTIQEETMETIEKRFTLSRGITYVAIAALLAASAFKALHLAGADQVLITSFFALGAALTVGSFTGIAASKHARNQSGRVIAVVAGTMILLVGYAFKLMHWPGGSEIAAAGVVVTIAAMLVNTLFVYNRGSSEGNLLTYLHEKYTPGIERFLLLLVVPLTVFWLVALFAGSEVYFVLWTLIVAVYCAGLQFIALIWRGMEASPITRTPVVLALTIVAFTAFILPLLSTMLPMEVRLLSITVFGITAALLALRFDSSRGVVWYATHAVPILFVVLAMVKMQWIDSFASNVPLNLLIVFGLSVLIYLAPKHGVLRAYLIVSLASYLIEIQ